MTKNTNNNNLVEIISLVGFIKEILKFNGKKIIYRGQSNKDWEVTSSAYRRLKNKIKSCEPTNQELLDYNEELIQNAHRYPDKETTTEIDLLAKLQHYGAATSLIDFTESALIALWFACKDDKTDGKVFCLNMSENDTSKFLKVSKEDEKKNIGEILGFSFRVESTKDDDSLSNSNTSIQADNTVRGTLGEDEQIATWEPPITDNRILKQDSFFIFNKTGIFHQFDTEFTILKGGKKRILKELEQLNNLSEETIFPDFYGFAQNNAANKPYAPQDAVTYFRQGNDKFVLGKHEDAIEDYGKAIELNPQFAEAYFQRGVANSALGKQEEAINNYDRIIELNPQYAETYYNRGNANRALGKHEEAIGDYDKVIERNPKHATVYNNRGAANSALGKHEKAIEDYDKIIELNPQHTDAYYNRGIANFALGNHEKAITSYDKVIELNSLDAEAYNNRGAANFTLGKYEEAIKDYNRAIELNPQYAKAYNNRGAANSALDKYEKAIKDCDKAIEIDPQDVGAYNNRGNAKSALHQYEAAIKDYDKALELNPQHAGAYNNRGIANTDLGNHQEAIQDFYEAKRLYEEKGDTVTVEKCEAEIVRINKLMSG